MAPCAPRAAATVAARRLESARACSPVCRRAWLAACTRYVRAAAAVQPCCVCMLTLLSPAVGSSLPLLRFACPLDARGSGSSSCDAARRGSRPRAGPLVSRRRDGIRAGEAAVCSRCRSGGTAARRRRWRTICSRHTWDDGWCRAADPSAESTASAPPRPPPRPCSGVAALRLRLRAWRRFRAAPAATAACACSALSTERAMRSSIDAASSPSSTSI